LEETTTIILHTCTCEVGLNQQAKMQSPVTLEEVTIAIWAFKAQLKSSTQCLQQRKVFNCVRMQ